MSDEAKGARVDDRRKGLAFKLALAFICLVSLVLIGNGVINMWLSYNEAQQNAVSILQEKARSAAERIEQFITEVEQQIGWTTHAQWSSGSLDQRRYDFVRLLRQVPAITELVQIDGTGKEQLKVSRLAMDVVTSGVDYSTDPRFTMAVAQRVWFSPVYFRKESEPYMTIAVAHIGRNAGVTIAEVNLKFIWDVVTSIKIGREGYAYVVDRRGRLIAHPDISLVLRDTDFSTLAQVSNALAASQGHDPRASGPAVANAPHGNSVLTAYAVIPRLDWLVFVELPVREAMAPVYSALLQTAALLGLGLLLAAAAGTVLARRLMVPIHRLQAGAEQLGAGKLDHRIAIHSGDEIEVLADRFNRMAAQLQESYSGLERKVDERTRELAETLEHQTATSDVLEVISRSPANLEPVFTAMLENAIRICRARYGILFGYDNLRFEPRALNNVPANFAEHLRKRSQSPPDPRLGLGRLAATRRPVHIHDLAAEEVYQSGEPLRVATVELAQARTWLGVPMLKGDKLIGAIVIYRVEVQPFSDKLIELVSTFANQAVIAIENARLLGELRDRSAELAQSVGELKTLNEIGQAVSSTLDLKTVLMTIVTRSVELSGADSGTIFRYRKAQREFRLDTAHGLAEDVFATIRGMRIREAQTAAMGQAVRQRAPIQLPDLSLAPNFPLRDVLYAAGYRSAMIVPLVGPDRVFGVLSIQRKIAGAFPEGTVRLMQTFASQSVLAIQNARLFREIEEQGRQLAIASQHKSQFLANMSHELRTPLNAVLGYAELLVDGIYGELPGKAAGVLERIQSNGKHLLQLINDVLDLSKIEAGQLTLTLDEYAMPAVVQAVVAATDSLACAKGLSFSASVAKDMPVGYGDERRLTQVLLNLVGNAIKFTDGGSVQIAASAANGFFALAVSDTGPGVASSDQARIFEEFQQVDSTSTRKAGGSGLGLAISKRIVEMHGGRISVESTVGAGSTFRVIVPVRIENQREDA